MSTTEKTSSEILMLPAAVGMRSCVGILGGRPMPLGFGNYFALADGTRILNFWAENMKEACTRFLSDGLVKVHVWTWESEKWGTMRAGLIWDERIPADWYNNKMCYTGLGRPPVEIATEMYALVGHPGDEMEYWRDAEMYWARRGQRHHPNGMVSMHIGDTAETLIADLLKSREQQ